VAVEGGGGVGVAAETAVATMGVKVGAVRGAAVGVSS
jgi:hypothetical protein